MVQIPNKNPNYVPWGHHDLIKSVVSSKKFIPVYLTGLSGNGKTYMVEQVCAETRTPLVRVNITTETDEDDLIGGFRLESGNTVWHYGPVVQAMKLGCLLLLDEVDLATSRIMCLQPILEGNGVFIKKINEYVEPKKGFNIIATANTKGQGDEHGKFVGANFLNEAFLDRFGICLEQKYPEESHEKLMLTNLMETENEKYVDSLLAWAKDLRESFTNGASSEIITTRRLTHIIRTYNALQDEKAAIQLCINRFDKATQEVFMTTFEKIHSTENVEELKVEDDEDDEKITLW